MKNLPWKGAAYGLASAALFGASTPLAKQLLGSISPWLLAGLLYLGSGIGLFAYRQISSAFGRKTAEAPLRRADLPWLAGAVLAGGVIAPVLLMIGLAATPASTAALLLNLEAVATMVIAWTVFREHFDRRILVGAFAILMGAALLSFQGGDGGFGFGALAISGACLAWGIDNNLTRKLSSADPVQIATIKGLVAGAVNLALAFFIGAHVPPPSLALTAMLLGLLGYGISLILFVMGLRHVGAARTGAYFSAAPFVGAIIGVALLNDPITSNLLAAAGLMAVGLYLHLAERHEHLHGHEKLEHEHTHVHDAHHMHHHSPNDSEEEPHAHWHSHTPLRHAHSHFPDEHHRHSH